MQSRTLGSLSVSVVGIGCNNFGGRIDEAATNAVVGAALDAGITLFDTADIYGGTKSEEYLGRALGSRRDEAVIATKFGGPIDDERKGGASAAYVKRAVDDSLRRLGTDRIDLYQLHFPDPSVPLAETLGALDELVREGKVREIGCSNFSPELIAESEGISAQQQLARFVSVQNEYSLLRRAPEKGVLDACEKYDLGFIPYFPLASGLLTGKYRRGEAPPAGTRLASGIPDGDFDDVERLAAVAGRLGRSLLELAVGGLAAIDGIASVIAGATTPEQVRANAAAGGWRPSPAELDAVLA
jgi:aryl-alcohol dehydrogenase-like predicted oxidoreductase